MSSVLPLACIHQLVERQVSQTPDAVAVIFQDQRLTYQELNQKANQVAQYLKTLGVQPETFVGVCIERSLDLVIALLGILKAGGAYVPLDPSYPQERLGFIIEDTQLPVLLTQEKLLKSLPPHKARAICMDRDWAEIAQQPTDNLSNEAQAENLAYIIYTSGSTGKPKGVAIEHRNTVAFIEWASEYFTTAQLQGVLASTSICFDLSVFEFFVTLSCGGKVILAKNALELPRLPAAQEVTLINTVPSAIAALFQAKGIPTSVQTINLAGEPLQNALVQQLYHLEHLQQVFNLYGPSEDTTYSTAALISKDSTEIPTIGQAITNSQVYLLDLQLNQVADGEEGEIYISGAGLARGYLNRPDLTADKFIPNPFSDEPGSRLYKTGDLAIYLPDGNLKFLGRIDHQVKIRGFRIELGEIEAVLHQHPEVKQVVLLAREMNPGDLRLVAYLVPEATPELWQQKNIVPALREFLKQKLPEYMVPSAFVLLEELPLTLNGKINRRALPLPQWNTVEAENYTAPTTAIEVELTKIWNRLLGIDRISTQDSFFELGGHSLLVIRLIAEISKDFQVEIPVDSFLNAPTIESLARSIEKLRQVQASTNSETEISLDPNIFPENTLTGHIPQIFLTGATGFLGTFLLYELLQSTRADIYCLIRANNAADGIDRIRKSLQQYELWQEGFGERIKLVLGNLSQPRLGLPTDKFERLAEKIDAIYHCGAWVNVFYPFSALKSPNVLGTQEVLRLASQTKVKPVHFISTVDVYPAPTGNYVKKIGETEPIGPLINLYSGYARSKFAAEQLVMEAASRGLPVTIHRPSNIMGQTQVGACPTTSFVSMMLKGCIQMGLAPDFEAVLNLVPVDYVSRAIVYLVNQHEPLGQAFNIVNPNPMEWQQIVQWMKQFGYPLQQVPYDAWYGHLIELSANQSSSENVLVPMAHFFAHQNFVRKSLGVFHFDCENTYSELAENGIISPPVDNNLLHTYFGHFIQQGYLNPPPQAYGRSKVVFHKDQLKLEKLQKREEVKV